MTRRTIFKRLLGFIAAAPMIRAASVPETDHLAVLAAEIRDAERIQKRIEACLLILREGRFPLNAWVYVDVSVCYGEMRWWHEGKLVETRKADATVDADRMVWVSRDYHCSARVKLLREDGEISHIPHRLIAMAEHFRPKGTKASIGGTWIPGRTNGPLAEVEDFWSEPGEMETTWEAIIVNGKTEFGAKSYGPITYEKLTEKVVG